METGSLLQLVEEMAPLRPVIDIDTTASPAELSRKWATPLAILLQASRSLIDDVSIFMETGLPKVECPEAVAFRRAAYHWMTLIWESFVQITAVLGSHRQEPAHIAVWIDKQAHHDTRNIGYIIEATNESILFLRRYIKTLRAKTKHWAEIPTSSVPTACPYELLYRLLCRQENIQLSLHKEGAKETLLHLQRQTLFNLPAPPNVPYQYEAVKDVADGRPFMVFACTHPGQRGLVFGANEPKWSGFPEIMSVARASRDTQLSAYIPLADAAFQKLKEIELEIERELLLNNDSIKPSVLLWEARRRAIPAMRDEENFLGGTSEMGLAFRTPNWHGNQPCYLCQAMMGYQIAREWNEKEKKSYLTRQDLECKQEIYEAGVLYGHNSIHVGS
ncbi:3-deoxy-d-manno-octulosonic acid transferase [Diplodia corticola]|uniref:3-deoxy-d-manno-octulosonic acid transferase n=1 Tax=Diplodia corticola TaxID=236234 RepID=A0A1J9RSB1_9PEZI|nr:3-deoxy-d-manno-octulosonic acid transferase [Diplodia corticola]OJD30413.1 3-deoxy-d-manno-octulosonic acid transferase [Diplodia corticola]